MKCYAASLCMERKSGIMVKICPTGSAMKFKTLTLSLLLGLAASPAFAAGQYLVRVPANVNLSAAVPETPQEPISLSLSAEALPVGTVGEPYSFNLLDRLTITGGSGSHNYSDTAWSLKAGDALPPGLSLSGSMIAGTPTAKNEAGTSFEVTGTYQDASGQQVYTIVVNGVELQVTQISAGANHTCAVTTEGAVKCWGAGGYGQLGNSSMADSATPVSVTGLGSNVTQISAGNVHTCAVHGGAAKCWGAGWDGRLGNGIWTDSATPVSVIGLDSGVTQIAAGRTHTCAVHGGAAKCWGAGDSAQIGNGGMVGSTAPVNVTGLDSGVTQIAAGGTHTCAVHGGAAKCWGANVYGQLGNGSSASSTTPVTAIGLDSGVTQIAVGRNSHTCAVHGGAAKCWGGGGYGQLGNGSSANSNNPVSVTGLDSGVTQISAGGDYTCAVHDGAAKCWGHGNSSKLGNGSSANRTMPVAVTGLDSGVTQIAAGEAHTCAVHGGAAKCWGAGHKGQLGDGTTTSRATPVDVLP